MTDAEFIAWIVKETCDYSIRRGVDINAMLRTVSLSILNLIEEATFVVKEEP